MDNLNGQKGFTALFVTLLVLTVVFSIGTSIFISAYGEQRIVLNAVKSSQAYYAAESGIEDAVLRLKQSLNLPSDYNLAVGGATAAVSADSPSQNNWVITSTGEKTGVFRKIETQLEISPIAPDFFYGAQVGAGGIELENLSKIVGNIFSNGNIVAESGTKITGTVQVSGAGNKIDGAVIGGDAYVNICDDSDVNGILYAASQTGCTFSSFVATSSTPSPVALPILDQDIAGWKAEAESGGIISGSQVFSEGLNPLGPAKIAGNLTIQNDAEIVVGGALWVTGNIIIKNNTRVHLAPSYGSLSGVILADGTISLENNSTSSGSGQANSYLMYLSTSALNPALTIKNNAHADIIYTSAGWLDVENNADLREITGYGIHLENNARITYELGLRSALFTSGPGGGWDVTSWKETQ